MKEFSSLGPYLELCLQCIIVSNAHSIFVAFNTDILSIFDKETVYIGSQLFSYLLAYEIVKNIFLVHKRTMCLVFCRVFYVLLVETKHCRISCIVSNLFIIHLVIHRLF